MTISISEGLPTDILVEVLITSLAVAFSEGMSNPKALFVGYPVFCTWSNFAFIALACEALPIPAGVGKYGWSLSPVLKANPKLL